MTISTFHQKSAFKPQFEQIPVGFTEYINNKKNSKATLLPDMNFSKPSLATERKTYK